MSRSDHGPAPQLWNGLPQTAHSALTPGGEIEQATKVAENFKQSREGWRRVVFLVGVAILALGAVFMVVAGMYSTAHP
jgi:hypothetical protein